MNQQLTEAPVAVQSAVNVHNEWDPLEEIIVGHAIFAQIPDDLGINALSQIAPDVDVGARDFSQKIIEKTEEDLAVFVSEPEKTAYSEPALTDLGD